MIEVESYWRRLFVIVKVVEINAGDVIVSNISNISDKTSRTSMERRHLLEYYTKLTPLEVELL
jgi:hypothetical protein